MEELKEQLLEIFDEESLTEAFGELTLTVDSKDIIKSCLTLRDTLSFDTLVDLCGVDYLSYGESEWESDASNTGFSRGRSDQVSQNQHQQRFAVVYHLLSVSKNYRIRVKAFVKEDAPIIQSVTNIWASADWYEREACQIRLTNRKNKNNV